MDSAETSLSEDKSRKKINNIRCPYCNKLNSGESAKCSCGYYFDNAEYENNIRKRIAKFDNLVDKDGPRPDIIVGMFSDEFIQNSGIVGGISLIATSVVWFIIGRNLGWTLFSPLIFFSVGVVALFFGLVKGNIWGRKNE